MWQAVRRELARLEWDAAPPLSQDLLSEWTQTVPSMVAIRRVLGPVSVHDPLAMLATATTGAARSTGAELTVAPSLHDVLAALAGVARVMGVGSDDDRPGQVATLNHVAYELAHWVRVRTTDDRAKAWLLAGETALDSAIHVQVCPDVGQHAGSRRPLPRQCHDPSTEDPDRHPSRRPLRIQAHQNPGSGPRCDLHPCAQLQLVGVMRALKLPPAHKVLELRSE